ncbi:uncharacterized protein EV422DRAFT_522130 [Fimicolochytrium jonesii]|uniref:uncharacterized protein n=1 Tax=Fimicolochytrium jonesii TaxID=1396493 RepID=UPI0022FE3889|nr:uncharacterized protein EV422DRAFT_522130 [Fimicolochytrium jonesii]KAI8823730.1 hypothetical protein EV422DRAFT_522130 [Fimicolochytrium jonesii]
MWSTASVPPSWYFITSGACRIFYLVCSSIALYQALVWSTLPRSGSAQMWRQKSTRRTKTWRTSSTWSEVLSRVLCFLLQRHAGVRHIDIIEYLRLLNPLIGFRF